VTETEIFASLMPRALPLAMAQPARLEWQEWFNQSAGMSWFGMRCDLNHERVVKVVLPEAFEHHRGGLGSSAVNGAVLSSMFDAAVGVAAIMQSPMQKQGTVELSIKLLNGVRHTPVEVYAIALKRSSSGVVFVECQLYSGGKLCAMCTGMTAVSSSKHSAVMSSNGNLD